jgi:hypothetical protein
MDYRLNQIDMELRERINEATSEGKVHRKDSVQGASNKNEKNKKEEKRKFVLKDETGKNGKIEIEAVKIENKSIDVDAVRDNCNISDPHRGSFLDIRK